MSERPKKTPVRIEGSDLEPSHMPEISRITGWKCIPPERGARGYHFKCPWAESLGKPDLYIGLHDFAFAGVWSSNPHFIFTIDRRTDLNYAELDEDQGLVRFVDKRGEELVIKKDSLFCRTKTAQVLIHPETELTNPSEIPGPIS